MIKVAAKLLKWVTIGVACVGLSGCAGDGAVHCSLLIPHNADDLALEFIGESATSCGDVNPGEPSDDVESCIFKSLVTERPFYAWF